MCSSGFHGMNDGVFELEKHKQIPRNAKFVNSHFFLVFTSCTLVACHGLATKLRNLSWRRGLRTVVFFRF